MPVQGPLLASLSSYRFVAHSFAPILALVCAEEAARAGLSVAGSPLVQGAGKLLFTPCDRSSSVAALLCLTGADWHAGQAPQLCWG